MPILGQFWMVCGVKWGKLSPGQNDSKETTERLSVRKHHVLQCIERQVTLLKRAMTAFEKLTRMWANAQRDGRPAEYRWRPLFNVAKFG